MNSAKVHGEPVGLNFVAALENKGTNKRTSTNIFNVDWFFID
jgi:hypothetical protein